MRKRVTIVAVGVCLFARLVPGQSVANYGFENGSLGPWYAAYVGSGSATVTNTSAHTGNYGLTFGPNNGDELLYQDISGLLPGQTYVVSAWVKATAPTGNRVTLAVATPQGYNWSQAPAMTPGTNWQQISQAYTATVGGTARIILYQLSGSQTTYWDDVAVTPLPPQNAGFESGSLGPWVPVYVAGGSATVSTTGARSENNGLTFGANPGGDELVYQDITGLVPGQTYLVSAWVKAPAATVLFRYRHPAVGDEPLRNR